MYLERTCSSIAHAILDIWLIRVKVSAASTYMIIHCSLWYVIGLIRVKVSEMLELVPNYLISQRP